MVESLPPADWFPDPTGRHEQRWWDGASWTEHVFSAGSQGVDPLEAGAEPTGTTGPDEARGATEAAVADAPSDHEPSPEEPGAREPSPEEPGAREPSHETPAGTSAHDELRALADDLADPSGSGTGASSGAPQGWFLLDAPVRVTPAGPPDPVGPVGPAGPREAEPDRPAADGVGEAPEDAAPAAPATPRSIPGGFVAGRPAPTDPVPPAGSPASGPETTTTAKAASDESTAGPSAPTDDGAAAATAGPTPAPGRVVGPLVDAARGPGEGEPVALENRRVLRVRLDGGSVLARQGTMVAHRGQLDVRHEGAGGIGRVLRRAATGEGVRVMRVTGAGEVFLADGARHVFLLHLEGDAALSVSGRSVLAFEDGLEWQVERVPGATIVGGGLFATTLRGDGWVALVSDGEPVVLRTDDGPVLVDTQALVAWTTGLATSVATSIRLPALVGLGSGEAVQLQFTGEGLVVVQPSEGRSTGT